MPPGVDGVNKTGVATAAVELQILRDELLSGHYCPPDGFSIPKSNEPDCSWVSRVAGSYCSAGHADGDGADMGESFIALIWLPA